MSYARIDDLPLPRHLIEALKGAGMVTVDEFLALKQSEAELIPSVGATGADSISAAQRIVRSGIGGNHPPAPIVDLAASLNPDVLKATIAADYEPDMARVGRLSEGYARYRERVDGDRGLKDEETAGKATDFLKQLGDTYKDIDAKRDAFKRPVLEASRLIDATFKNAMLTPLEQMRVGVRADLDKYVLEMRRERERLAAEQRAAEEAAAKAAAQAERERLARLAEEAEAAGDVEQALEIEQAAAEVQQAVVPTVAPSKPAGPLVRSSLGSTLSSKKIWGWRVVNISLVPPHLLVVNDAMVKAVLSSDPSIKQGAQPVPGIEFFYTESSTAR